MSGRRYPEEFKIEAVKQVTERNHAVSDVAQRLGVTSHSIYNWSKRYGPKTAEHQSKADEDNRIKALEKELKRVTEERDILKKAAVSSSDHCNTLFNHV